MVKKAETQSARDVRRHQEVLADVAELFAKKNADYNGGVELASYFPFGLASYSQMIHVKSQRIVSLVASGHVPQNESVIDSLKDIINYATFALMALEE